MVEPRPDPTSPDSWAAINGADYGLPSPPPIPPPQPSPSNHSSSVSSPWDNAPTPEAPEPPTPPSTPMGTSPRIPSTPPILRTGSRSPAGRRRIPGRALLVIAFVMLPGVFAWVVGRLPSSEPTTSSESVTATATPTEASSARNGPSSGAEPSPSSGPSFGPPTPVPATAQPVPSSMGPIETVLLEVWSSEATDDLSISIAMRNEGTTSYLDLLHETTPFAVYVEVPNDARTVKLIARDNRVNEDKAMVRCRISANGHLLVEMLGESRAFCAVHRDGFS